MCWREPSPPFSLRCFPVSIFNRNIEFFTSNTRTSRCHCRQPDVLAHVDFDFFWNIGKLSKQMGRTACYRITKLEFPLRLELAFEWRLASKAANVVEVVWSYENYSQNSFLQITILTIMTLLGARMPPLSSALALYILYSFTAYSCSVNLRNKSRWQLITSSLKMNSL